jgi:regulator of protease activity HflC (stomatin/prohibitin superfamily)
MPIKANSLPQAPAAPQTRWQRFSERRLLNIVMGLMIATLAAAVLYPYVVTTVPPGRVGVLWKRLGGFGIYCWCIVPRGTVLDPRELREEGLHVIWPWDRLFLYDLRLKTETRTYNAISRDGVSIKATVNVRFQLRHDSVAQLHKFIGPQYPDLVVSPEIGSRAREIISKNYAEDVYSTRRGQIQECIRITAEDSLSRQLDRLVQLESSDQLTEEPATETSDPADQAIRDCLTLSPQADEPILRRRPRVRAEPERSESRVVKSNSEPENKPFLAVNKPKQVPLALHGAIQILDALVLGIELPPEVVAAINRKIEQHYIAQEYEFRVQREQLESRRKGIEANGIREFQQTVSQGISDSYLRWRGIEATLQLAQSNNTKIVIVGSGKDGLPIILGNVDSSGPPQTPADAGTKSDLAGRLNRPALPLETSPAAGLPTPSGDEPPESAPASPNASKKPPSLLPRSLSEVQSMIFRFPFAPRSTGPVAGSSSP